MGLPRALSPETVEEVVKFVAAHGRGHAALGEVTESLAAKVLSACERPGLLDEGFFLVWADGAPRETVECTLAAAEAGADARGPVEIHQIAGGDPLWVDPRPEEFAVRVTPVEADQGVVALALPPGSVTVVRWQR